MKHIDAKKLLDDMESFFLTSTHLIKEHLIVLFRRTIRKQTDYDKRDKTD